VHDVRGLGTDGKAKFQPRGIQPHAGRNHGLDHPVHFGACFDLQALVDCRLHHFGSAGLKRADESRSLGGVATNEVGRRAVSTHVTRAFVHHHADRLQRRPARSRRILRIGRTRPPSHRPSHIALAEQLSISVASESNAAKNQNQQATLSNASCHRRVSS
jgi:hypothetical protein